LSGGKEMKGRRKNIKTPLTDFLKYRGNRLPGNERNAFEKELQKDLFAEEAAEGFSLIQEEMIAKDIKLLDKQLKNRTVQSRRMSYYRIAASIAVLMVISSVYIVLDRTRPSKLSENIFISDTLEIREQEALKQNIPDQTKSAMPSKPAAERTERKTETEVSEIADRSISDEIVAEIQDEEISKDIVVTEAKNEDNSIASGQIALPASPEKNDSFLAAASEKKAFARSVSMGKETEESYQPPQPVAGRDSFDIYIQKNIRIPDKHPSGQTTIVTLNLRISKDGIIEIIKVVESPGKEYSTEAIRLINEGPEWKPAVREGSATEENINLDIVFR
jgi:hypothetical protein